MEWVYPIDWAKMFIPDVPLLEIIARGSIMYLALVFLLRVILNRQTGTMGLTDLLVIVLIADASQNAMAADYTSLPNGIVLVATLIFWNYTLEWLAFHSPWFDRLICSPPLLLVKNGRMVRANMRKELVTEDDLLSQLRLQGIDDLARVKTAYMEGDGRISAIEKRPGRKKKKTPDNEVS